MHCIYLEKFTYFKLLMIWSQILIEDVFNDIFKTCKQFMLERIFIITLQITVDVGINKYPYSSCKTWIKYTHPVIHSIASLWILQHGRGTKRPQMMKEWIRKE